MANAVAYLNVDSALSGMCVCVCGCGCNVFISHTISGTYSFHIRATPLLIRSLYNATKMVGTTAFNRHVEISRSPADKVSQ